MGLLIENCAGNVHVIQMDGGGGDGLFKIDPPISDAGGGRCIIQGIPTDFQEIFQPIVTLDDQRSIAVFGSAWSETMVAGLLLLGQTANAGDQLASLLDWYDTNRLSQRMDSPVSVSVAGKGYEAYVVGLRLGQANAEFNTQPFSIILLISK